MTPSSARSNEMDYEAQVEHLSARLHEIYMIEAQRQGDVRHDWDYSKLKESTKEYDRVLARFILVEKASTRREALDDLFMVMEEKNFRRWLEEEIYDEFVPLTEHDRFLRDSEFHHKTKVEIAHAMNYCFKGLDKLKKFYESNIREAVGREKANQ